MKVLLDTNIVIHREAGRVTNQEIGTLFRWLDQLHHTKCIHPLTLDEIKTHSDPNVVKTMTIKLDNYHVLKTETPLFPTIDQIIKTRDKTSNDVNDSKLLNELVSEKVDAIITEDKAIHQKALQCGVSDRVFSISSFLEKVISENPELADYKVLSVRKEYIGNINVHDEFFDTFRADYLGFNKWFSGKADEPAYVSRSESRVLAFLYLKPEGPIENYSDIHPVFTPKKRLKIGTFKVSLNGYKLGERFLKIVFDNALRLRVDEIYVTIFPKTFEQRLLIDFLTEWGFRRHGTKTSPAGVEDVYVRDFRPVANVEAPKETFPYVSAAANVFLNPIYPEYHTELFPDSILRTESPDDFVEDQPHRNAISKVYVSRSWERNLKPGDVVVFYRTGGYRQGCITTVGVIEGIHTGIKDASAFIRLCRKRSVFTDAQLIEFWDYNKNNRPFIVNFLNVFSLKKRPNLKRLIELGIVKDINSVPRGFERVTKEQFELVMKESESDASFVVH